VASFGFLGKGDRPGLRGLKPRLFVYNEVLRYYAVLFHRMIYYLDLNSEQTVIDNAQAIIKRISKDNWNDPHYMPVTRSMSSGRTKLLVDFLEPRTT
jgi:hypothetical protein